MTDAEDAPWTALVPAGRYVAVPRRRPLIVASWDRAVLRYLADSVLSVPPGAGQVVSMVLTAGLRMLRYPGSWLLAV
ncbi:MAG: hypothetical protein ACRDPD_03605, partial [Streptosporangiaceae bacterium]